ncbi:MAG: GGDEF domain-containing response regulator [Gemmataceae bacterium]
MDILVADDDAVQRRLLEATLGGWGYRVRTAADGVAAWDVLRADSPPELAVLDWMMPNLDGPQLCRRVREHSRDRYTYLLLLTSRADRSDLIQGLEAGADDYLIKPCDPAELKARLNTGRRILHLQNELIAAREAMRRQATRDGLTGAWNRAAILEVLDRELARARREARPVGVVLTDIDHFKRVNDTHGHQAGDAVLREFVARLSVALRPDDLVGRYGGEEFLIVLPGCDEAALARVCERLRQRVAGEPFRAPDGQPIPVTTSFGAVIHGGHRYDGGDLVRSADAALYRAKAAGRDRVEVARP